LAFEQFTRPDNLENIFPRFYDIQDAQDFLGGNVIARTQKATGVFVAHSQPAATLGMLPWCQNF
jgi:hypothetical protein